MFHKIAFLLQTHDGNPHVERLCRILQMFPGSRIFAHHDFSKSEPHPSLSKTALFCRPHRITEWSRTSQLQAELDLIGLALREMPEADWLILLSGRCYPVRSPEEIVNCLTSTRFDGFLDSNLAAPIPGLPGYWWRKVHTKRLCRIPFVSKRGKPYMRQIRVRNRGTPFSGAMPLRFGANWFILRRRVAEFIMLQQPYEHPVLRFFQKLEETERYHMSPEEAFMQTLLGTPHSFAMCNNHLRFIDWHNAVDSHPNILNESHWERLINSPALFARKFDAVLSRALLDRLDGEIMGFP